VRLRDGSYLVAGKRVSAFSNAEERAVGLDEIVPFALETRLRERGARYESGPMWSSFAVTDGKLVTGQNPASSLAVARAVLAALA
jgi:putative intracellular protease/amidase